MPAIAKGNKLSVFVSAVEKKLGDEGIKELTKEYGQELNFIAARQYEESDYVRLIRSTAQVLYGDVSDRSLFEVGRILAEWELQSSFMKIGLKIVSAKQVFKGIMFNPDILRLIEAAIPKFAPTLSTKFENPDPKTLEITFFDTAIPAKYYEGEWYEIFKHWIGNVSTTSRQLSPTSFQIIISSEQFKNLENYLSNA